MRIAVWHNLPSGGGKRALHDHVRGLLARGHHVESWCPPQADQSFLPLSNLVVEHVVEMRDRESSVLRRGLSLTTNGATRTYARLSALDGHARRCAAEITKAGCDVVLVASSVHITTSPVARYVSTPSVLYLQEPTRHLYEALPRLPWAALPQRGGVLSPFLRLRDTLGVRAMRVQVREEVESVQAFDRVLVNSYFSRESLLRSYGSEARVCYLGVDTEHYIDRARPRRPLVVGVGVFAPHKRVEVAIDAVASLGSPRPTLVWIGNRARPAYLKELVERARRRDVAFDPRVAVSHEEVVEILNEAAVMVYAPRLEPFGYAPLEAAACGLPVVAKAEGGVRESVLDGETGFLVDHDGALGPAIAQLLSDESLARRMGAAARRRAETIWSLAAATARLEGHLAEVLDEASSAAVPLRATKPMTHGARR